MSLSLLFSPHEAFVCCNIATRAKLNNVTSIASLPDKIQNRDTCFWRGWETTSSFLRLHYSMPNDLHTFVLRLDYISVCPFFRHDNVQTIYLNFLFHQATFNHFLIVFSYFHEFSIQQQDGIVWTKEALKASKASLNEILNDKKFFLRNFIKYSSRLCSWNSSHGIAGGSGWLVSIRFFT